MPKPVFTLFAALTALTLCASAFVTASPAHAASTSQIAPPQPSVIGVAQTQRGVRITISADAAQADRLPEIRVGDTLVPGKLIAVLLEDAAHAKTASGARGLDAAASDAVAQATTTAWTRAIEPAAVTTAQDANGEPMPERTRPVAAEWPQSPIVIVEEGNLRGQHIAVMAVSLVFEREDGVRFASSLDTTLPGTKLIEDTTTLLAAFELGNSAKAMPALADVACNDYSIQPKNPQASKNGWKIRVSRGGIQQVTAASLAAAGMQLPVSFSSIRIQSPTRQSPAVSAPELPIKSYLPLIKSQASPSDALAIRRLDLDGNGLFNGSDAIRFYAREPGDRWNTTEIYWLTVESGSGSPDMSVVGAPPATGSPASTALERGQYVSNQWYEHTLAGPDGDHWFATRIRSLPGLETWSFNPTMVLPSAGGPVQVMVSGSSDTNVQHNLQFSSSGSAAGTTVTGAGTFTATFGLNALSAPASFGIVVTPGQNESIFPDRATWERPVSLSFGGQGAAFLIRGGSATYQAVGTPAQGNDRLYDVTDPNKPALILLNGLDQFTHAGSNRSYVMAGTGTLFVSGDPQGPVVSAYTAFPLTSPLNLQVLYITPVALYPPLQPLINLRRSQGYQAEGVGVEAIYDWWSYGQVSPDAIRNFLRYAYSCWTIKPIAVTLVGDGSSDPHNYTGYNNVNYLPPYMAPVDPYRSSFPEVAEAACDACYVQLDGANPLSDRLADLLYGRLPVKSTDELIRVVNKIVGYETAAVSGGSGDWRNRIAYVADNYRLTAAEGGGFDSAGNFEAFSELSIAQQPSGLQIQRMYFDPAAAAWDGAHEPDAAQAYARVKAIYNAGAGLINYAGHANVAQTAVTVLDSTPNYLLFLTDPDTMQNVGRLPIVLQMTCLTSAFETPIQHYATTLDERLLLAANGAAAVWGSSGLGVSYGHEALQRGFYKTLWSRPRMQTPVGVATAGGYLELFTQTQGTGEDSLRTFILLGDPLMKVRVGA